MPNKFSLEQLNNDDIYYSNKASWQYMSASQFKDFMTCEAQALAKLKQDWQPTSDPIALLVGNYVHSYFESTEAHEKFKANNRDAMYKEPTAKALKQGLDELAIPYKSTAKKDELMALYGDNEMPHGDLLSPFKVAERMIRRIEQDEDIFPILWNGEREVPVTGKFGGVEWKGKIDLLNIEEGYFVDLKTNADFGKRYWEKRYGGWTSFVEAFGYVRQIALYEQLLEQQYAKKFTGYIYAVSKQDPCNVEAIQIDEYKKRFELGEIERLASHFEEVKTGQVEPTACGKCEYCREHKRLTGFVYSDDLIE
ncbi:PD-(D/E)XK nuclease-like domain-containing protein [Aerococcus kribbianus]|uniref:PD-(D/E)XK nuclease-like domain-containing protein n=1 Tax=Aerococcus kribbianus TaxID=2999064 RepID=A0A9X3FNL1_9LACT|nr:MULTISPECIES: PD-(D/E)XK nuclease-like domain-containing protein [unclassified Aerococcus]MCZ0717853.1 PD-(D/E)XK nuclease-like domain-containing protein [Aerococcus sp. YH-aer221]MCZ0726140.1 PD-(D/E)XK nuclease-like domain-containing protein [Aerococcus sp. YH-aer222]